MDKLIRTVSEVLEFQYRVHCAVELVRAVHTTIAEGQSKPDENDLDALFGAYWYLHTLDAEMQETGERLYDVVVEEKKK